MVASTIFSFRQLALEWSGSLQFHQTKEPREVVAAIVPAVDKEVAVVDTLFIFNTTLCALAIASRMVVTRMRWSSFCMA